MAITDEVCYMFSLFDTSAHITTNNWDTIDGTNAGSTGEIYRPTTYGHLKDNSGFIFWHTVLPTFVILLTYQRDTKRMNTNLLFAISMIVVGLILILINYESISDFYTYSVPLKDFTVFKSSDISRTFQDVLDDDSKCFTTLNENLFCYLNPTRFGDSGSAASIVKGKNGIEGEIHFDPVDVGANYFLMLNMTLVSDERAMITFVDKNYRIGNSQETFYEIDDDFEFTATVEKFDTFVSHCNNYEGTIITIVQYLGIQEIDGNRYFLTWHTGAESGQGIACDYPQIIQHSLDYNFREL